LEAELWFFGASFGLLIRWLELAEANAGVQAGDLLADSGEFGLCAGLRIAHLRSERLPGFGRFRLFRIRHIRGGMLEVLRFGIGELGGRFTAGGDGLDGLVLSNWSGHLVNFLLVVFFGFEVEDEFGVSSYGGLDFGGGVGEPAADGALEAVNGEQDAVAGDLGSLDPLQKVFVDAENIAAAQVEQAGGVGVVVDAVAVVEVELIGEEGTVPLDEFEFDPDAIGMVADAASAAMGGGWFGRGDGETGDFG
jgi:hypothetical protein